MFYSGNLNAYIYCYQNPVMFVDPNGKQSNWLSRLRDQTSNWVDINIRQPNVARIDKNIRQPTLNATQPLRDGVRGTPEQLAQYESLLESNVQIMQDYVGGAYKLGAEHGLVTSGMGTGLVGAYKGKVWKTVTDDNFVGKLATRLGKVVQDVDQSFEFSGGAGDVDIVTKAFNIEVKSGSKMKLSQSLKNLEYARSKGTEYILFMPKATNRQIFDANKKGITVIKSEKILKKTIK
ncbi:hypothetical protein D3C87_498700 [compost metagenome]